ncbi:MAG: riboflavin synthase [Bacteriovoracaceae bacterium]|jgi:riboflavin synthase|nr:riboflavin synthase [Bacteriovoracaceae bacterium]
MFTGLVKEIGTIKTIKNISEGLEISVLCHDLITEIKTDDSVALDGVCQTVVSYGLNDFTVQTIGATLGKTTLGILKPGYKVNLELALKASDRLGGHMVQGHVNTTSKLQSIQKKGENYLLEFSLEDENRKYVINEGSISINGISLTVCSVSDFSHSFIVSIIPHSYHHTNLVNLSVGNLVNIEFDVISKYVENMLKYTNNNFTNSITNDWLSSKGF